jgi:ribose-phosphate pyrophosphokinase
MNLALISGSANPALAGAIATTLRVRLTSVGIYRFPDGELHVEIQESIRGDDVYLIQPTGPPVDEHLMELLLVADACRRAGVAHLTAVIPYFGYERQDRRATGREPVSARLVADMIQTCGVDRVVAVDLHSAALEGFFDIPLEHVSAVSILAATVCSDVKANSVVVSPDLGAAKLADAYARHLNLPVAIVHKIRVSGEAVSVTGITGNVRGFAPIIVDDMISTGGTVEAAIHALLGAGSESEIDVVATHALLVGSALQRLRALPVRRLIVSDSVAMPTGLPPIVRVVSIAPLLADVIERLHNNRSLSNLIVHR